MKRILYLMLIISLVALTLVSCSQTNQEEESKADSFEIYLVKDMSTQQATETDLDRLILEDTPVITLNDITDYYWNSQVFKVRKEGLSEQLQKAFKLSGTTFVVTVNGERIYLGAFWTMLSSVWPPETPIIYIDGLWNDGTQILPEGINWEEPEENEIYFEISIGIRASETIKDKRIYDVMKRAGVLSDTEAIEAKAVYFVSKYDMQLTEDDLNKHTEVIVTDSFDNLKSLTEKKVAIWIDKNAIDKVEQDWLQKAPQKDYPIALVGYNNALYSFREKLGGFGIHGPKINWEAKKLEPGFSVWKLKEETSSSKSAFMDGYETIPSVQAILDVTNMLLEGRYPDEEKRIGLYVDAMKAAFHAENGGNGYIAVRMDTLDSLDNENARARVLEGLKDLSPNVYDFEQIKYDAAKLKKDKDGSLIGTINGTILSVKLEEYNDNEAVIRATSWFGNLGAVFPKYKATYKDGKWHLELISMAVS